MPFRRPLELTQRTQGTSRIWLRRPNSRSKRCRWRRRVSRSDVSGSCRSRAVRESDARGGGLRGLLSGSADLRARGSAQVERTGFGSMPAEIEYCEKGRNLGRSARSVAAASPSDAVALWVTGNVSGEVCGTLPMPVSSIAARGPRFAHFGYASTAISASRSARRGTPAGSRTGSTASPLGRSGMARHPVGRGRHQHVYLH